MKCAYCGGDHPIQRCNSDAAVARRGKLGIDDMGGPGKPLARHRQRAAAVAKRRGLERQMQKEAEAKKAKPASKRKRA